MLFFKFKGIVVNKVAFVAFKGGDRLPMDPPMFLIRLTKQCTEQVKVTKFNYPDFFC